MVLTLFNFDLNDLNGFLSRAHEQRSTMSINNWLSLHPRNFCFDKIVRTFIYPPLHLRGCEMTHCWELLRKPFSKIP